MSIFGRVIADSGTLLHTAFSTTKLGPYVGVVTAAAVATVAYTPMPDALDVLKDNLQVPIHQELQHTIICTTFPVQGLGYGKPFIRRSQQ